MPEFPDILIQKVRNPKEAIDLLGFSYRLDLELEKIQKRILELGLLGASPSEFDDLDFQIRSGAYRLAFEIAPEARNADLQIMTKWLKLDNEDEILDVSAGTGFLTKYIAKEVSNTVYALDPSSEQLRTLEDTKGDLSIDVVCGSPHDRSILDKRTFGIEGFDIITSYGGLHHITGEKAQIKAFNNFAEILYDGGRVVVGDVGGASRLAHHFETSVTEHCLTSHVQRWITEDRLRGELTTNNTLEFIRCEEVPVKWSFTSELQMALFMKALHADPRKPLEVVEDLNDKLGYTEENGIYLLNWPMLFFELENYKQ